VRYDPQGKPMIRIEVPAQQVTSCCFGGANLDLLFITTARTGLPQESLAEQPLAGDVFIYETDTQGLKTNLF
jgi:sugar lactone lactonase YvrE